MMKRPYLFGEVNRVLEFSEVLIASIIRPMSIILGLYHHQGTHSREVQTSRHKWENSTGPQENSVRERVLD
jgi:hypothetical protein